MVDVSLPPVDELEQQVDLQLGAVGQEENGGVCGRGRERQQLKARNLKGLARTG